MNVNKLLIAAGIILLGTRAQAGYKLVCFGTSARQSRITIEVTFDSNAINSFTQSEEHKLMPRPLRIDLSKFSKRSSVQGLAPFGTFTGSGEKTAGMLEILNKSIDNKYIGRYTIINIIDDWSDTFRVVCDFSA
jgi:hypothetical protein